MCLLWFEAFANEDLFWGTPFCGYQKSYLGAKASGRGNLAANGKLSLFRIWVIG
jgi:hypothetical protein